MIKIDWIAFCMFQYISCCSLSAGMGGASRRLGFNTSHVVVYPEKSWYTMEVGRFQYISCCSLSLLDILQTGILLCFNTSHVVVYHAGE